MDNKFKSKISIGLLAFLIITLGFSLGVTIFQKPYWLGWVIHLPIILFVAHLFATTNYIIKDNNLVVSSSFFVKIVIDISTIRSVLPSTELLSAPALSFNRLKIMYGKNQSVLVSPKNRKNFIDELKKINPAIRSE